MITTWPSPAKLNLFLYITGQRADGYHDLQTLFQFLDFGDTLTIETTQRGALTLHTPFSEVDNEHNLIIRAARLLKTTALADQRIEASAGAEFSIEKRIPMGADWVAALQMRLPCWWH